MNTVLSLFKYETYKMLHSKLTVIIISLMVILAIAMGLPLGSSPQSKEIHKAMMTMDGKIIDNDLMKEMNESIDWVDPEWNQNTWKWTGIQYMLSITADDTNKTYTADDFYEKRIDNQEDSMAENKVSEEEIEWWKSEKNQLQTPFTYISSFNARALVDYMGNILLLILLLAAVCISTVFAGEHRMKTDQIILSTKNGRGKTFIAKLMAAFTFILIWSAVLTSVLYLTVYLSRGLSGLEAIVQMEVPSSAYPYTFMQFFGKQLLILFTAALLFAAVSMALSEFLRNGIAVMGLMMGFYLATQFIYIPKSHRVISQFMTMLPTDLINLFTLYDHRLVSVFGHYHTMFDIAPVIYVFIATILCLATWWAYRKYQVGSR